MTPIDNIWHPWDVELVEAPWSRGSQHDHYLCLWVCKLWSEQHLPSEIRALFALLDLLYGVLATVTSTSWRYRFAGAVPDQRHLRVSLCRHIG